MTHSQPTYFHPASVPAQVDGERGLRHQSLLDHVVKDRHNIVSSNGLESQSQDAISNHVSHEGSLCAANAKHLVLHGDAAHLDTHKTAVSHSSTDHGDMPVWSVNMHFVPGALVTSTLSMARRPVMLPVPYWMDRGWSPHLKVEDCWGLNVLWFSAGVQMCIIGIIII